MIKQEIITIQGKQYKRTYSDSNLYIKKEGTEEKYAEAIDMLNSKFIYEETDKKIPEPENLLKLTRGDIFRGVLQAKGVTRQQLRAFIELMPEETPEQVLTKELAFIDFDESLHFYRNNPLVDKIGEQLEITSYQMTKFFETNDWHELIK